jgi:hypothetical protein
MVRAAPRFVNIRTLSPEGFFNRNMTKIGGYAL